MCWEYCENGQCVLEHRGVHPHVHVGPSGTVTLSHPIQKWQSTLGVLGFRPCGFAAGSGTSSEALREVSGQTVLGFGKHRGLTFAAAIQQHPEYARCVQSSVKSPSKQMEGFVRFLSQKSVVPASALTWELVSESGVGAVDRSPTSVCTKLRRSLFSNHIKSTVP